MFLKTHLSFNIFFFILFYGLIRDIKSLFLFILFIIGTIIPDVDSRLSNIGKRKIFRIIQFFTKHRGFFHSVFFIVFIFFITPFFVFEQKFYLCFGIFLHIFLDSFTIKGIKPFYPIKFKLKGFIKTGKISEKLLFLSFIFLDFSLFFFKLFFF